MRKSAKNFMTFALAASMVASTFAPAATVSAASKSNVITKATYNSGATVKYSYNKKGLVTKAVSSSSSKSNNSDISETVTTTFKYNKKNKISSKTEKDVKKVTSYEVDKTTGLKLVAKTGTVTTTDTTVTTFKYNKKGLATESVATTTTTKSGNSTSKSKSRAIYGTEMSDGKILAGYNKYNADGTVNFENTKNNAYYYNGIIPDVEGVKTETYTENGDGSYKETIIQTTPSVSIETKENNNYYLRSISNDVEHKVTMISVKEKEGKTDIYADANDENKLYYKVDISPYKDDNTKTEKYYIYNYNIKDDKEKSLNITITKNEDGTYTDSDNNKYTKNADESFTSANGITYIDAKVIKITSDVAFSDDSKQTSTTTNTTDNTYTDKKVATTKYSYDKKKRVKKAVTTTVKTDIVKTTNTTVVKHSSKTESSSNTTVKDSEKTNETTYVATTAYTYDKKGRAKKVVSTSDGKKCSNSSDVSRETSYNEEKTTTASDGTSKITKKTRNQNEYASKTTTVVKDGKETTTVTHNPYTKTETETDSDGKTKTTTTDYAYTSNGIIKFVETEVSKDGTKTVTSNYYFDSFTKTPGKGARVAEKEEKTDTTGTKIKLRYNIGDMVYIDDDAKADVDSSIEEFEKAQKAPYDEVKTTRNALDNPSKSTTTYKYDKVGNVKSAKCSGTTTTIEEVKNETYGNTIYEWDASGEAVAQQVAVTHKFTDNDAMENTVKKGTKVLTKKLVVSKGTQDRSSSSSSYLSRALYTIKGKKATSAKVANKQQWIIQNGPLNGEVGLD